MVTKEELSELIAEMHKNDVNGLVNQSEDKKIQEIARIKDWVTLFRRNLDIFNQDFLEIKMAEFQKVMINNISDNEVSANICSRGLGKNNIARFTTHGQEYKLFNRLSNTIVEMIYKCLYTNCNIYLDRKLKKFDSLYCLD